MRHGTSNRRQRNRGNGNKRGGQPRMQVYDSNGPDVRIRGTAHQVVEKYLTLAKDASSSGDPVLAESYLQHAEHYQRIIISWNDSVCGDQNTDQNRQNTHRRESKPENDLALPPSILGGASKTESEVSAAARTPELDTTQT